MNSPTDTPSGESTASATAAFLFDEPNPIIEDALASGTADGGAVTIDTTAGLDALAQQAAAAQTVVEPPTVITPEQEAAILAAGTPAPVIPPVQLAPIIEPVNIIPMTPAAPVVQAPVVQPTQAEIQQHLNVYNVNEADYDAIFDTEDKQQSINALNAMMQKVVRQAVTMSHVLVQEAQNTLQKQVQPYMQFADEQKHSVLESAFYGRHADLQAAKPVVDAVLKQFQGSGQKFANPEQLFDAVAQNTKAYLLQLQQLGQTAAPVTQGQVRTQGAPQGGKPRMAALPSGGQGGAGTGAAASGKTNTAQSLFG